MEFELVEDVQALVKNNPDVEFSDDSVKSAILKANSYDLFKTVKAIDSSIVIKSVQIVDDEFVEREL